MDRIKNKQPQEWVEGCRIRAWELSQQGWMQKDIATVLGVSPAAVSKWLKLASLRGVEGLYAKPKPKKVRLLTKEQRLVLVDILRRDPQDFGFSARSWSHARVTKILSQIFGVVYQASAVRALLDEVDLRPYVVERRSRMAEPLAPYAAQPRLTLYHGDAAAIFPCLPEASVDCIVASPPAYAQPECDATEQADLEERLTSYVDQLVYIFRQARPVLKPRGSLWVHIGDAYWNGKGKPSLPEQEHQSRRLLRPQDRVDEKVRYSVKQQLLIPHRFAVAMQADGWIVRNDNVWENLSLPPDPARDHCTLAHEYMFHFVQSERYYFDMDAVAVPARSDQAARPPSSVWRTGAGPAAEEGLVALPVQATLPSGGVLLDPFCGSGSALAVGLRTQPQSAAIGIDASVDALDAVRQQLADVL